MESYSKSKSRAFGSHRYVDHEEEESDESVGDKPKPKNFDIFVPWACKAYGVEADVIVTRTLQSAYKSAVSPKKQVQNKQQKKEKTHVTNEQGTGTDLSSSENVQLTSSIKTETDKVVKIEAVYDDRKRLVHVKFLNNKNIPRTIMQVVALTLPYQKYLTSITINRVLCVESLYEISKFLPNSQITELCFDGTFLKEANYHLLLPQSKLKHLSLARCTINDDVVKMITDQLKEPYPASKVLSALNLSSNKITDAGANYIADMLQSNRKLCYLNLAGNMITDKGGVSILNTFQKFPLQPQELKESRVRYVAHLKEKSSLVNKFLKELQTAALDGTKKKTLKKRLAGVHYSETDFEIQIQDKAEYMANQKLGFYSNPFSPENTEVKGGVVYCLGNNTLFCLNLAYNNLGYISLKKLVEVLKMQQRLNRTPRGLIRVVTEGNLMPVACEEFVEIERLLESAIKTKISPIKRRETSVQQKPGK
ncbi:hypothetical protein PYW07_011055 [Mythimna separata]|uniref:Leucine-rich repeat-containing protein 71 n=1 Tax=Mythimna separata TaxID=271217 RepID=A0AAD7Y7E8_MYTSE|nr:hypothetical protein PYW07_011055 [Mythimna separata]